MKQLAWVSSLLGLPCFQCGFIVLPVLAQHLYGTTDPTSEDYNKIGNWVGVLFGFYNGFAAFFAFLLPVLAKKFSRPATHMIALIAGGFGIISYYFFKNEMPLIISMGGIGFAWCSILAMPYAMLTQSFPAHKWACIWVFSIFLLLFRKS